MTEHVEIEELLFEVADLREAHAKAPAILRCLDGAESQLMAAMNVAGTAACRGLIDAALRLLQVARPEIEVEAAPVAAPPPADDLDPELLDSFLNESIEYLAEAESSVLRLEADPRLKDAIDQIFRAFHTVKGTAAFLELDSITEVAHRSENLLSRARNGEVVLAGGAASAVLSAIDVLKALVGELKTTRCRPGRPANLAQLLAALDSAGEGAVPPRLEPAAAEQAVAPSAAPVAAGSAHADGESADSVRVRVDRLDRLIDGVGELVIAQSMVAADPSVGKEASRELLKKVAHAGKIVRELQDLAMSLRMVPLRATFQKLARVVRDASRKLGKHVQFVTEGSETEIDRGMVDVIGDPLVHMVRNACDHGLETSAQRLAAGKSSAGTLTVRSHQSAESVVIELIDDGRGLDREKILARAVKQELITADQAAGLPDADVYRMIFLPGFSTSEKVTDMSGRGVGMDVVRRAVESLSGRIEIDSTLGQGTTFRIRLPLTLAITDGMLVRVGDQRFIIPTVSIAMSMRPAPDQLFSVGGAGRMVAFRGRTIPVFRLSDLSKSGDEPGSLAVVLNDGDGHTAVLVDEILGKQQVVTKTLGDGIPATRWIAGGAILGDGRVGLIIDPSNLLARFRESGSETTFLR